ncbi:MAG: glycosyltransferase [Deltaproteobacteria bacterium]|jgi:tetratricopeptide (TPR) repeat protein|nr:glycosyltransferase [Deltaproteobacteria bacterium]
MLIFCLGSEYFHQAFTKLGHSLLVTPHQDGFRVDSIFNQLQDRPDLLVYTDHLGQRAFPEGLSNIYGIPKVYYAVDTPINFWWQKSFAPLFDFIFTDQKPYAEILRSEGLESSWLPVGVDAKSYQSDDNQKMAKLYDFGFVGVIDPARRPKRSRLVETLSNRYSVKTAGSRQDGWIDEEESAQIYRQSRLALNENLFPGVTTRMLEVMASGSVLFTEKAGGDLGELFQAGEDFAWFEPQELLGAADYWLGNDKRRRLTAKRALEKVRTKHDITNRAETLLNTVKRVNYGRAQVDREAWDNEGQSMFLTALRWPQESGRERMSRAEKLLDQALEAETISNTGLFYLGHIKRMRRQLQPAEEHLTEAFERGEPRAALGLAFLNLGLGKLEQSKKWLVEFTQNDQIPTPERDTVPFEAVKSVGDRLLELGYDVTPGFSRMQHDPAIWTAFEFYQMAFRARPEHLETARSLASLLLNRGATAEAMEVAQKGLESHPDDEILGGIFTQAGRASYLTIN